MRFLFSLILTLFAITAQSQVMKLTSAGKSISISIDDIVFVRAGTPSGSVITYGQTQARLNVSQTMSAIQSASCSNLVSLSVVENISGQPQSTTLLFNVRMIAEVIPDVNNKAVMTIRTSPRVKYTTVSSYTSVTNTISACITGGGGGGSVVTDATLSGDGSSGDPLSVNPIGTSLIENNAVTNGKLATMPALTIKGNNTGATGAA
ncbi:MAG: hypothetical protein IT269_11320, partial [Saprospiraceae bacterium]|nr:hypothetical protein [Saprospiraceae bacterium]